MAVIIIPIVVWFLTWLQRLIYQKFWSKNLDASVKFSDRYMIAGEETEVVETMTNAKILPLPWVHMKFEIFRNGKTDNQFRNDLFNILFHQQIVRKSKLKLERRGVYQIKKINLLSYDLFISKKLYRNYDNQATITVYPQGVSGDDIQVPYEKLMGEIATRRYTLEDPFLFKGIREYQPEDSFRNINFKASARNNRWLVNTHEYTLDQKVRIVLLTDKTYAYSEEEEYEAGLRYAAELANRLEQDGVPVELWSNGLDSLEGTEPRLKEGCSSQHTEAILEALARLDIQVTGTPGEQLIRQLSDEREADEYYVIICPDHSKRLVEAYQQLRNYTDACMYISPVNYHGLLAMPQEEKRLADTVENFFFFKL